MSENETRLYATIAIWLAVAVLGVAAMVTGVFIDTAALVVLSITLVAGAATATNIVWNAGKSNNDDGKEAEKAKRRSKVQRLVDGLDDRELDELRTRLMSSDDSEATSLEELLKANGRQRR